MATGFSRQSRRRSSTKQLSQACGVHTVLHEGWCTKESGTQFFGKTNWKKRWFKLVQTSDKSTHLQYYRGMADRLPVGTVKLDVTYCVCEIEDSTRSYPNCFTVGPIIDDGATRTYLISCSTPDEMCEWMTAIDAAIQGVPGKAEHRMRSASVSYRMKNPSRKTSTDVPSRLLRSADNSDTSLDGSGMEMDDGWLDQNPEAKLHLSDLSTEETISDDELESNAETDDDEEEFDKIIPTPRSNSLSALSSMKPDEMLKCYADPLWRLQRWKELCVIASTAAWNKIDRKGDVVIARCRFGRNRNAHAVIKVEGVLPAAPSVVYQFLQLSTKPGGKLDYIFRNENFLQHYSDSPQGEIIQNEFSLPLPRISHREVVAMKVWIPEFITADHKAGFVMVSVDHPNASPMEKDAIKIHINPSGFILSAHPGPDDGTIFTQACIIVQVALKGGLHQMMKGAYNSGLLKLGMRTTFNHIRQQLRTFMDVTDIGSVSKK